MISDELREHGNGYFEQRNGDCEWLYDIADRIDAEMVELPRDRDGVPINVGDVVYLDDGRKTHVSYIRIARGHTSIDAHPCGASSLFFAIEPTRFTHTSPDSFESIADEMDKFVDDTPGIDTFYASTASRLRDFADRIRKLAKEQDHE